MLSQGTIIVILGVIGIVAFGSINTGLSEETSATHLAALWGRAGWLFYFFFMSLSLALVYKFATQLDLVLSSRSDLSGRPFAGMSARTPKAPPGGLLIRIRGLWKWSMIWVAEKLEEWTAEKDEKVIAWTLGIGWACVGGGLAGECLVFAKAASVSRVSLCTALY
jgi:magnesium transporter